MDSRLGSAPIRAVVAAEWVSSVGSSMTVLALPWFVLASTGSATKLGLVLGIGSIPYVTLPLPAGTLIARIGARQTMVIADAVRLPLLAAIPALYKLDALSFPLLVALVALTSVFTAAHMPAQRLILAEVVGDEESLVARVNAYLDGAQTTAPIVGPALAGVLIAALGPANVLYIDAASFGIAAVAVGLFVPRGKPVADAEGRGLLAGVRYILRSRLLVALCVSTLTMEPFFTLFVTTLPVFAFSSFDRDARIAGVFYAAMGAGALLGMPVVPVVVRRWRDCEIMSSRLGSISVYDAGIDSLRIAGSKIGYLNLRNSVVNDLVVEECPIGELDLSEANLTRATFRGCAIETLTIRNATLRHVDLRGARLGVVEPVVSLRGAVIDVSQVVDMAPMLATGLGVIID